MSDNKEKTLPQQVQELFIGSSISTFNNESFVVDRQVRNLF
jgi:hypothetical protein